MKKYLEQLVNFLLTVKPILLAVAIFFEESGQFYAISCEYTSTVLKIVNAKEGNETDCQMIVHLRSYLCTGWWY